MPAGTPDLTLGCADGSIDLGASPDFATTPDFLSAFDLSPPLDATSLADLAAPQDLVSPVDFSTGRDMAATTQDLAVSLDFAVSPDLTVSPDLAVSPDLSVWVDLSTRPDVAIPLDFATLPDLSTPSDAAPCPMGQTLCFFGCIETESDPFNCGACNNVCPMPNTGVSACTGGVCRIATCLPGLADCDGNVANGCESELAADVGNCGGCGHACPSSEPRCLSGACEACGAPVLVIGDDLLWANASFEAALLAAGMKSTVVQSGNTYTGAPDPADFGAVIVLTTDPLSGTDMPVAGQQAIERAAAAGTGVVFVEFATMEVQLGRWQALNALMLLEPHPFLRGGYGPITFRQSVAHPIWTGLPASFTTMNDMAFASVTGVRTGGIAIAGASVGPYQTAGVVVKDDGTTRIAQINYAPDFIQAGQLSDYMWENDPSSIRLLTNAMAWASHCR